MADERSKAETMNTRKRSHAVMTGAEDIIVSHEDVSNHCMHTTTYLSTQNTTNNQAQRTRTTRPFERTSSITSPYNNHEAGHSLTAPSDQMDMYSHIIESAAEYLAAVDGEEDDSMVVDGVHHGLANASIPEEDDHTTAVSEADHEGYDAEDEASATDEEQGEEQVEVESEKETEVKEEEDEGEQVDRPRARGVSTYPFPLVQSYLQHITHVKDSADTSAD